MTDAVSGGSGKTPAPVQVEASDLPLYCPSPRTQLWNMHPRVFLDIAHSGQVSCPYCGTSYKLAPGAHVHSH